MTDPERLTVAEAARMAGSSVSTIRRLIRSRKLGCDRVKQGRRVVLYVRRDALLAVLSQGETSFVGAGAVIRRRREHGATMPTTSDATSGAAVIEVLKDEVARLIRENEWLKGETARLTSRAEAIEGELRAHLRAVGEARTVKGWLGGLVQAVRGGR